MELVYGLSIKPLISKASSDSKGIWDGIKELPSNLSRPLILYLRLFFSLNAITFLATSKAEENTSMGRIAVPNAGILVAILETPVAK
jgi:hypothetical protein